MKEKHRRELGIRTPSASEFINYIPFPGYASVPISIQTPILGALRSILTSSAMASKGRCYVCPTAEFLHCYLELFDRPEIAACFGASGSGTLTGSCRLLLLHSELAKLTGAAGALSIRQERQLVQVRDERPIPHEISGHCSSCRAAPSTCLSDESCKRHVVLQQLLGLRFRETKSKVTTWNKFKYALYWYVMI